jgi:hypothetical protein
VGDVNYNVQRARVPDGSERILMTASEDKNIMSASYVLDPRTAQALGEALISQARESNPIVLAGAIPINGKGGHDA